MKRIFIAGQAMLLQLRILCSSNMNSTNCGCQVASSLFKCCESLSSTPQEDLKIEYPVYHCKKWTVYFFLKSGFVLKKK